MTITLDKDVVQFSGMAGIGIMDVTSITNENVFFSYWLTRVVPEKEPLNGCCCCCCYGDILCVCC